MMNVGIMLFKRTANLSEAEMGRSSSDGLVWEDARVFEVPLHDNNEQYTTVSTRLQEMYPEHAGPGLVDWLGAGGRMVQWERPVTHSRAVNSRSRAANSRAGGLGAVNGCPLSSSVHRTFFDSNPAPAHATIAPTFGAVPHGAQPDRACLRRGTGSRGKHPNPPSVTLAVYLDSGTYHIESAGEYFLATLGSDWSSSCNNFDVSLFCSGGAATTSPADSDPQGFTVNVETGAITATPQKVRDGYRMRLRAVRALSRAASSSGA